jgi:hypothetical protein
VVASKFSRLASTMVEGGNEGGVQLSKLVGSHWKWGSMRRLDEDVDEG